MGSKKTIIDIRAGNRAAAQLARQRTRQGFRYTNRVDDSIYGNLTTNISGNTTRLTVEQDRLASSLKRLKANQVRGSNRISRGSIADVQNAYGSAVAGGNALNARTVQVTGRAGQTLVGAQTAAGGIVARGNEAAASTLASGVQLARAGARGQVADALAYRARNDAALAAQNDLALKQMVLASKLEYENFVKKSEYEDSKNGGSLTAVATSASNSRQGLFDIYNSYYAIGPDGLPIPATGAVTVDQATGVATDSSGATVRVLNATEAATVYMNNNAIVDENEKILIANVASVMYQNGAGKVPGAYGTRDEAEINAAITQRLQQQYPDYAKNADIINGILNAQSTVARGNDLQTRPPSDGTEGGDVDQAISAVAAQFRAGGMTKAELIAQVKSVLAPGIVFPVFLNSQAKSIAVEIVGGKY